MIYVASCSSGEYDDYWEWPIMAFKTEAEAIACLKKELAEEKRKTYIKELKESLFYYKVPEPGEEQGYDRVSYLTIEEMEGKR